MDFTSIPIIVVCCYIFGEIYKFIFRNKQETYKLIPIFTSTIGGILGVVMFFTCPEIIFADNGWVALGIGIVSGASATGTNQIIKQLFIKSSTTEKAETKGADDNVSIEK